MAKKDLDIILRKVRDQIDASNNLRDELDRQSHEYSVSTPQVYREFLRQLNDLINAIDSPNKEEIRRRKDALRGITKSYVEYMYASLKSKQSSSRTTRYVFSSGSNKNNFIVTISSPRKSNVNIFGILKDIRRDNTKGLPGVRSQILRDIFNSSTDLTVDKALFGALDKNTGVRSGGLVQLGHDKAGSVSIRRKAQLLKQFQYSSNIDKLLTGTKISKEVRAEINLAVSTFARSSYSTLKDFSLVVKLKEESAFRNQGDAAKEKSFLRALTKEVQDTLKKEVDFFNQRGSPSAMDIVKNRLITGAIKAGARGKVLPLKDSKSKSSIKINQKTVRSKGSETIKANVPRAAKDVSRDVDSSNKNWFQLLPLINAKLTDQVMKNMRVPRLQNRTGRLAQSAKVINVEQTPQGSPSFVFDYERNPYDVFDRTKGAPPWNTPQRDPRALVDLSVRQVVREMAIDRFFTRRA